MSVGSSGSSTSSQGLGYLNTATTLAGLLGTSNTSLTSLGAPVTLTGLSSGVDTSEIIAELMQVNEIPQQQLTTQLNSASAVLGSYQALSTDIATLQSVSDTLASPSGWQAWIPNSTTEDATATVGDGAIGGSITFSVDSLAQADSQISSGSVTSESAQVTSGPLLVAVGGGGLGVSTLSSSNLSIGNHTIAVTQASAGASLTSASAPAASTTVVSGTNDTLDYDLDGNTASLTIAAGTYTTSELAAAVQSASGGALTASINTGGAMVLTTTAQGSATSFQVTGGNAASALGFSTTPTTTANGTDGIVTVDGVSNDLSNFSPGNAVTLNGTNGSTISATFAGPLVVGSMTADEVNTGNGSLSSVVEAINATGLGISASAINTGTNQYNLSLQSTSSGAANTINIDPSAFAQIGQLTTVTAAANAQITVGSGTGAFVVTNDSNEITGLMPGVTIDLQEEDPGQETTVSLAPDGSTMATTVQSLVTAANQLITDLNAATAYTPGSGTSAGKAGPLLGNPAAEALLRTALGAISEQAGVNSTGSAGLLGITMNTNGTLNFDSATFSSAYDANPTSVANTFVSGGSSSNPLMSFYESTDATQPGQYDVAVSQAAAQATDTGTVIAGGAVSTPETLAITSGGTVPATASYTTTAGESLTAIAAGLNQAFATNNVTVNASVVNGALTLTSQAYGAAASFTVTSTASGAGTTGLTAVANEAQDFAGTDVEGTINGQAATGTGQLLLGTSGTAAQGMLVLVSATAAQLAAAGGSTSATVSYRPGIAQALANVAYAAGNPDNGTLVNSIAGEQSDMSHLSTEISAWNPILQQQEVHLTDEYTAMETTLSTLKTTQSYLTQFMASSSSSSSSS
jgi:flagellar hook-associated protein 2